MIDCLFHPHHSIWTIVQFGQVIIDTITSYRVYSFHLGALPFGLLISRLLELIGFEIATTHKLLMPC